MKSELIKRKSDVMVVLDVRLDNFYAFQNFHMNLTYPKKIVGSSIKDEHLPDRPNFRYKKVNIIMGANASGKTTLGHMLRSIFNFVHKKNYDLITDVIDDVSKVASFTLDMVCRHNILYRISCQIAPKSGDKYTSDDISVEIREEKILSKDSYASCIKRLEEAPYFPEDSYIEELEKVEGLDWFFEYPRDTDRVLSLPNKDETFKLVLENILKALDPSIQRVDISNEVDSTYVIRINNRSVIIQDGEKFETEQLSSGTKAGVEIALVVSALMQNKYSFYYCDEKFSYIHSDIEKAVLSLMVDYVRPNGQLFFTSHNTDILDVNLPKHSFTFLRKDVSNIECPITCIDAAALLKRNTDSLKSAVDNDMFSSAPAVDTIYAIAEI